MPIPPTKPNNNHIIYIFGEKIDAAIANEAIKLPIIPIGRHPHLLHKADATGARLKYYTRKVDMNIK